VGVTSTQLYDGKLVLSYLALRARGATGAPCAVFGLSADGSGIVDRPLVRDLIFVLMSLHLPRGQRHAPATAELEAKVAAAIDALRRPEMLKGCTLMLCDTGADPNEDDLCAVLVLLNVRHSESEPQTKNTDTSRQRRVKENGRCAGIFEGCVGG